MDIKSKLLYQYILIIILLLINLCTCIGGDNGIASEFPILGALFAAASKAFDKITPNECFQLNRRGITRGPIGVILTGIPYKTNYPIKIFKDGWQQPDFLIAAVLIEFWHRYRAAESIFDPNKYKNANKLLGSQAFWGGIETNVDDNNVNNQPVWSTWWNNLGDFFSGVNELMEILIGGTIPLFVSTRGLRYNSRFLLATLDLYSIEKFETIQYLRGGTTADGKSFSKCCGCNTCSNTSPLGGIPSHLGIFTDTEGVSQYSAITHLKLYYDRLTNDNNNDDFDTKSPSLDEWSWDNEYNYVSAFIIYVRKLQQRYHYTYTYSNRKGRILCGLHVHDITKCIKTSFKITRKIIPFNVADSKDDTSKVIYAPWYGNDSAWSNDPKNQIIKILQYLDEENLNTTNWDTLDYVIATSFQYLRIRKHLQQVWTGGWLHYHTSPNFFKKLFKGILRLCRLGGKINPV